jgi:hypothetical protein
MTAASAVPKAADFGAGELRGIQASARMIAKAATRSQKCARLLSSAEVIPTCLPTGVRFVRQASEVFVGLG